MGLSKIIWLVAFAVLLIFLGIFGFQALYGFLVPLTNKITQFSPLALLAFAFLAGVIVNFGPCSIAILPAYIAFYLGLETKNKIKRALRFALLASVGVILFYFLLGLVFTFLGIQLARYSLYLKILVILVLLYFAGQFLLGKKPAFSFSLRKILPTVKDKTKTISLISFGMLYGAGGLSCFLPILLPLVFYPILSGDFFTGILGFLVFASAQALFLIGVTILVFFGKQKLVLSLAKQEAKLKKIAGIILLLSAVYLAFVFLFLGM